MYGIFTRNAHHLPLSLHGIGWRGVEESGVGMLTFPRPCSLDHAQDLDATLTWSRVQVGMLTFPRQHSLDLAQDVDATLTWGVVGSVGMLTLIRPRSLDLA